jgi:hypothetical protein
MKTLAATLGLFCIGLVTIAVTHGIYDKAGGLAATGGGALTALTLIAPAYATYLWKNDNRHLSLLIACFTAAAVPALIEHLMAIVPRQDQNLLANVSKSTFSFWQTFSIFASCTVIGVLFSVAFVTAE